MSLIPYFFELSGEHPTLPLGGGLRLLRRRMRVFQDAPPPALGMRSSGFD